MYTGNTVADGFYDRTNPSSPTYDGMESHGEIRSVTPTDDGFTVRWDDGSYDDYKVTDEITFLDSDVVVRWEVADTTLNADEEAVTVTIEGDMSVGGVESEFTLQFGWGLE